MIQIVCTTRSSREQFLQGALLGRCLPRVGEYQPVGLNLCAENSDPLGHCYNDAIEPAHPDDVLVFGHDDVYTDDWARASRLAEALVEFDVLGVAGNRCLLPGQQAWYLLPGTVSLYASPGID